jgi:hypothetical protein
MPMEGGDMRGRRWLVLMSCSFVMMFASSVARAAGGGSIDSGTIRFVGAIVEPTCSAVITSSDLNAVIGDVHTHQSLQRSCSEPATAGGAASAYRPYDVDVVHLSTSESDRVLNYFANYVRASRPGSADPVLVTQTYE